MANFNASESVPGCGLPSRALSGAVREGFEPSAENPLVASNQSVACSIENGNTQIRAQIGDAVGRDLSRVVAAWPQLPAQLKAAILAIVSSVNVTREGDS
jgi:hypothetical protein